MTARAPTENTTSDLRSDLLLVVFVIAFDVAARLLPHLPNLAPVAASALFVGTVLHRRALAPLVPLLALAISDSVLGFDGWRLSIFTYVASVIPALLPMMSSRLRAPGMFAPIMIACSLIFFAISNFGVWAFSGMYPLTVDGLLACYVAALPFLQHTVVGDLLWAVAFFGGAWLVRKLSQRLFSHDATGHASTLRPSA
ncbi:MAG: DUF6580 family putative transport protein [Xanthobacteraceae bacterium]